MPLTLTVKSYQRLSPAQEASKILRQGSLSIGRSSEADWTLPDPERQISKVHCRIDAVGDSFVLTDTSTNGVFHNDAEAPVGRDQSVALGPGDQLRLGDYEIEVTIGEEAGAGGATGQDTTSGPIPALEDPFPDPLLAGTAPADSETTDEALPDVPTPGYADDRALFELDPEDQARPVEQPRLLGVPDSPETPEPPPPGAAPDHLPGDKAFFQTPSLLTDAAPASAAPSSGGLLSAAGAGAGTIPDDWDEDEPQAPQSASPEPVAAPAPPLAQPAPQTATQTIPDDWSLEAEEQAAPPAAAASAPALIPDDWDDDDTQESPPTMEQAAPEAAAPVEPPAAAAPVAEGQPGRLLGTSPGTPEQTIPDGPLVDESAAGGATESTMLDGPPDAIPADLMASPEAAAAPGPGAAPIPDPTPAPMQEPVQRPTPGPRSSAATPLPGASQAEALQAFLAGAQLDVPPVSDEDAQEQLHTLGEVYRILVQGMMEVLAARSSLKNEFRVEQTMIQPVQNNPLKFSLNVDNAMENLLTKKGRGYMSPVAAMQEAFGDLQAHQIATLAGMQSALQSILERFDPDQLEQRLESSSMLESILPGKRKARYWDTFQQLYREIAKEAEDDFQKLFGQAFAEAYEKEIKKQ